MPDHLDPDILATAQRVADLSRRVHPNPQHQARLRQELMRRHQELSAGRSLRPAPMRWPRLTGLKRLFLVAPPALAAAVACFLIVWALQISGHQSPERAEAARITQALARTVPTVTVWQATVRQQQANRVASYLCSASLQADERLYLRVDKSDLRQSAAYFFATGHWYRVTANYSMHCPQSWQWVLLPANLGTPRLALLAPRVVDGHHTEGFRYVQVENGHRTVVTVWVEPASGLVIRLERVEYDRTHVIERDTADYRYRYRS